MKCSVQCNLCCTFIKKTLVHTLIEIQIYEVKLGMKIINCYMTYRVTSHTKVSLI